MYFTEAELEGLKEPLKQKILEMAERLASLRATFDLRWKADMRGIKKWQEATGKTMEWPDHADLVVFLLDLLEKK